MSSPNNPDFSLAAKKKIADSVRRVAAFPAVYGEDPRIAVPRSRYEWLISLDDTASGSGWYKCTPILPPEATDPDPTTDLVADNLTNTVSTGAQCYAFNAAEVGKSGHNLPVSVSDSLKLYVPALLWRTKPDGTYYFAFRAEDTIKYGTMTATWDKSGVVTLQPCLSDTDSTAISGAATLTCNIYSNGGTPPAFNAASGAILAYVVMASGQGLLLSPPILTVGGSQYQVWQADATGYLTIDWVMAH